MIEVRQTETFRAWLDGLRDDNARARILYDKVARFAGFIRYDHPMG